MIQKIVNFVSQIAEDDRKSAEAFNEWKSAQQKRDQDVIDALMNNTATQEDRDYALGRTFTFSAVFQMVKGK